MRICNSLQMAARLRGVEMNVFASVQGIAPAIFARAPENCGSRHRQMTRSKRTSLPDSWTPKRSFHKIQCVDHRKPPASPHPAGPSSFPDGRSPGSRVDACFHLPGQTASGLLEKGSPLTVAGAATALNRVPYSPRKARGSIIKHLGAVREPLQAGATARIRWISPKIRRSRPAPPRGWPQRPQTPRLRPRRCGGRHRTRASPRRARR